ncbi:hypothetical protein DFR74_10443 [Nocardia puris]|uniref:Cold shock CspA family protein n=2 Tax=Nocardia puris TaxID=208602 RepID=A0A366DMP6_9NOCA|nr:hypothetical protein DFR74_10443 [Nocardia puris]
MQAEHTLTPDTEERCGVVVWFNAETGWGIVEDGDLRAIVRRDGLDLTRLRRGTTLQTGQRIAFRVRLRGSDFEAHAVADPDRRQSE